MGGIVSHAQIRTSDLRLSAMIPTATVLQNTIDNCRYMNGTSEYPGEYKLTSIQGAFSD